jgi:hypothetical protein
MKIMCRTPTHCQALRGHLPIPGPINYVSITCSCTVQSRQSCLFLSIRPWINPTYGRVGVWTFPLTVVSVTASISNVSPGIKRWTSSLYSQRQTTNAYRNAPAQLPHNMVLWFRAYRTSCRGSGFRRLKFFSFSLRRKFIKLQNTVQ